MKSINFVQVIFWQTKTYGSGKILTYFLSGDLITVRDVIVVQNVRKKVSGEIRTAREKK